MAKRQPPGGRNSKTPKGDTPPRKPKRTVPVPTGVGRSKDWGSSQTAMSQTERTQSPLLAQAIEMAREGDDSMLLPYQPTPSINPPRPRTLAAGYDRDTQVLRIRFRDGAGYEYENVPPRLWRNFKRVKSPGRFINRHLNYYPYSRADW